jgi:hypothetical protein
MSAAMTSDMVILGMTVPICLSAGPWDRSPSARDPAEFEDCCVERRGGRCCCSGSWILSLRAFASNPYTPTIHSLSLVSHQIFFLATKIPALFEWVSCLGHSIAFRSTKSNTFKGCTFYYKSILCKIKSAAGDWSSQILDVLISLKSSTNNI